MTDKTDTLKQQWEQNKCRWEQLCTEQEALYNPDFERVFNALFDIAPDQREVFNTHYWNMSVTLPEAIDTDKINRALQAVGIVGEVAERFVRYAELTLQGKKLMQQNATLNAQIETLKHNEQPPEPSPEGWRFYPIHIIAPQPLHDAIGKVMEQHAQRGEGLFSNSTEVAELPDEFLDEFMGVEVYNVVCSFQPFLDELRRCGVTGTTMGVEFTRYLFQALKGLADYIKTNTAKPEAVKSYILEFIKELDKMPVWGLIFQILILQGLIHLLEHCTLKEGDNGYYEAQGLCNWLAEILTQKVMWFAMTGYVYGDGDKQRLQPLCDFLYNTKVGRAVQDAIFGDGATDEEQADNPEADTTTNTLYLPSELDTDRAREYFTRAVELKWMRQNSTGGYDWVLGGKHGGLARLGYFLEKVYCPTNTEQLPEQALNRLFGVSRLASAITQLHNAKKPQRWRAEIDNLFND